MPIAKTGNTTSQVTTIQEKPSLSGYNDFSYNGVPVDMFSYFDIPINSNDKNLPERLSKILLWANDKETIGDKLQKLRDLENQLGVPRGGESRIERLYRYVVLADRINDLRKRQDALSNRRF